MLQHWLEQLKDGCCNVLNCIHNIALFNMQSCSPAVACKHLVRDTGDVIA